MAPAAGNHSAKLLTFSFLTINRMLLVDKGSENRRESANSAARSDLAVGPPGPVDPRG
jgi:hypothetical protein